MTADRIAVVGMACRYPDAESPNDLWKNVLAGRRAFRRLPDKRMRLEDYYSPDPTAPDRFYTRKAAVIEGYEFDRVKYRIGGSTFRATDMTHWLALDTVAKALEDAGFPGGKGLPGPNTGVVIGNTLTGEFSRANLMRLRWPYVRRTIGAALREQGWDDAALAPFLERLEQRYKAAFPPVDEDTLAGGLANTIAGRICNYFDFNGGGYTVDGACSSSLLSVANGCNALTSGQLDVAIVGGVDLSIDPFEVIGFAKTGALATGEMRVYDKDSNGFWPGEGCGMLVLMRDEDAVAQGLFRYATIAGWGYSSDGKGGITRPEADGHRLAMKRAYSAAGFGLDTVFYLEGHGTGTAVGDATELRAFSGERREADPDAQPALISTVKGNFGHTKAAAGVAGLIKAILAVRHQVIPPATSHVTDHAELTGDRPALRVPDDAQLWPEGAQVRAGVSSMGFGGINAHIVVEHADGARRVRLPESTKALVRSRQDTELLLLDASDMAQLRGKVAQLAGMVEQLSFAEVADLAATLQSELDGRPIRAAIVATTPEEAQARFEKLLTLLDGGARSVLDTSGGVFLGVAGAAPRIGFLFPGQGAGRRADGGAIRRRFSQVDRLYAHLGLPVDGDQVATQNAQPRIVASSVAGLRVLATLGIEAVGAAGHSLGELTALHWAGAMDEDALLRAAAARGRVMADASDGGGTMAGIVAGPEAVTPLLTGEPVVIAGYNSPRQTVVSGPKAAVERVCALAERQGLGTARINVSHAFHSEAVAPAATAFREYLSAEQFAPLERRMVSTVTGTELESGADVAELLTRQVLDPVRFTEAVGELASRTDLLLEVGPGRVLRGLAVEISPAVPVISLDADSPSLAGLLQAVAAAYVLGAPVRHGELFRGRFTRPLPLDKQFKFFESPAEYAPEGDFVIDALVAATAVPHAPVPSYNGTGYHGGPNGTGLAGQTYDGPPLGGEAAAPSQSPDTAGAGAGANSLEVLLRLAAERAELPLEAVNPHSNPLDELHLSSITVGQIMNQASRELGISAPLATSAFATSTLAELAELLDGLTGTALPGDDQGSATPAGVAPWVRAFSIDLDEVAPPPAVTANRNGTHAEWQLFSSNGHPFAEALREALEQSGVGDGVLLCLPSDCDEDHARMMLAAARASLSLGTSSRFVAVGDRRGGAGLAKTLHLEEPGIATTVVTLPLSTGVARKRPDEAVSRIVADVAATSGFSEVHYDAAGVRRVPILRPWSFASAGDSVLGSGDVLLVTGGGKGITAESALAVARETGAAVALLGRSDPADDEELAGNLERMSAAGVTYRYVRADVAFADQVKAAVNEIRDTLGPVTAVLHGAGRNVPGALANLDEASFRRTLAPKITGLQNVLQAVDPGQLKLLVTFGSIIGRAGLRGQADYSTANDWMTDLTRRVHEEYPSVRCVSLEWSVWSGAGMGERLGVLESLMREGIDPIAPDEGIAVLKQALADPTAPTALVVMSRAGDSLPTIALDKAELPLLRFLDRVQVHYPGVELVVDAELSAQNDLYLPDHLLDGDLLFPAVLGMEAMTQTSAALTGRREAPVLENLEFLRPIVVPVSGSTTVRIATLAEADGSVRAVIRSSDTGFQADHFRATLRYPRPELDQADPPAAETAPWVPLTPETDLYGPVLFQGDRFQRLLGYRRLHAKYCVAEINNQSRKPWFAAFLPDELVLADPGTRDALMHSIQCNVPEATLLPAAIERIHLADPATAGGVSEVLLYATERSRDGDTYIYDLDVRDGSGTLVERWEGLTLQAVRKQDGSGPWEPALLGPYLERRTEEVLHSPLRVAVQPEGDQPSETRAARRKQTATAISRALGRATTVRYRADGRPEADGAGVSASHGAGVTFAVAGDGTTACDVQVAEARAAADWSGLLGDDGYALATLLSESRGEDFSLAATRVWGAIECLRKTGRARVSLTVATGAYPSHWAVLCSGGVTVATFATTLKNVGEPVVFAMLSEGGE